MNVLYNGHSMIYSKMQIFNVGRLVEASQWGKSRPVDTARIPYSLNDVTEADDVQGRADKLTTLRSEFSKLEGLFKCAVRCECTSN